MQEAHQSGESPDRLWDKGFRDAAAIGTVQRLAGLTDSYKRDSSNGQQKGAERAHFV
jgi:hypothetical protein